MLTKLFLLFLAGLILDLLGTVHTKAVVSKKIWWATTLSGVITVANYGLLTVLLTEGSL